MLRARRPRLRGWCLPPRACVRVGWRKAATPSGGACCAGGGGGVGGGGHAAAGGVGGVGGGGLCRGRSHASAECFASAEAEEYFVVVWFSLFSMAVPVSSRAAGAARRTL